MKFLRPCMAALLLWMTFSCNYSEKRKMETDAYAPLSQKVRELDSIAQQTPVAPPDGNQQQRPGQPSAASQHIDWDKKIVKNANLNLEVQDYKAFNQHVHASVKQWGGYVAQEEEQASEYKMENTVTIKVPVEQFENLVQSFTSGKEKVVVKRITSEDVTGEVIDTRSRMEAKRQIRQRYMDLLKQAKNMEEILQVQDVINDIQVQIESATGRINYLTHAATLSTVQLTFYQVLNAGAVDTHEPSFGDRALQSLKNGLWWMGDLLVLLLNLWPLTLLVGILIWGFKRWKTTAKMKAGS